MLQHLYKGRMALMIGRAIRRRSTRGSAGIRKSLPLALREIQPAAPAVAEDVVDWNGKFRGPLEASPRIPVRSTTAPSSGPARFVLGIAEQAAFYGDGFFATTSSAEGALHCG